MIAKDSEIDLKQYHMNLLDSFKYKGNLYVMPMSIFIETMAVNGPILEEENIRIEDTKWTWKEFLDICKKEDKGIFVLAKTSNPSSGELQNQVLESGKTVYATLGQMCEQWGTDLMGSHGYSGVGAVVGATYPAQLDELRKALPHTFFLVPGYGAQGGAADDVAPAFDQHGLGAVINSSRGIMCAWQKEACAEQDYAAAAAREAIRMRDQITAKIGKIG
jgi:orotidine-5'-phosphate decarboxylase